MYHFNTKFIRTEGIFLKIKIKNKDRGNLAIVSCSLDKANTSNFVIFNTQISMQK